MPRIRKDKMARSYAEPFWKIGLYIRLSREDDNEDESESVINQELICKGWFLPSNTYDCGSFVVNETAVVGKEQKGLITAGNQHKRS